MGRWLDRIKNTNVASSEPATQQVSSVLSASQPSKNPETASNNISNSSSVSFVGIKDKLLEHLKRKKSLGHRIEILRILVRRIMISIKYENKKNRNTFIVNDKTVEEIVDYELAHHGYDLENAIDSCRSTAPEPELFCKCGYQPPFCSCGGISIPGIVTCNTCEHFTPDKIGDGGGIGSCALGVESTQEVSGKMPLFRYSKRHCDKFVEKSL